MDSLAWLLLMLLTQAVHLGDLATGNLDYHLPPVFIYGIAAMCSFLLYCR